VKNKNGMFLSGGTIIFEFVTLTFVSRYAIRFY